MMDPGDSFLEYMAFNEIMDIYDDFWSGPPVECPDCGAEMGYNDMKSEFKCPLCGRKLSEYDL